MLLNDRRADLPLHQQRALIARLSQGAAGRALGFDLAAYTAARADALLLHAQRIRRARCPRRARSRGWRARSHSALQDDRDLPRRRRGPGKRPPPSSAPSPSSSRTSSCSPRANAQSSCATSTSAPNSTTHGRQTLPFAWIEQAEPRPRPGLLRHAPQPAPLPLARRLGHDMLSGNLALTTPLSSWP